MSRDPINFPPDREERFSRFTGEYDTGRLEG